RPQIAHNQRSAQDRFFPIDLVADAHACHAIIFLQDLLRVALQAHFRAQPGDAALQLGAERATASLHDAGSAEAEHIFGGANDLIRADLVQFKTERETRDTLEEGPQFGVALYIDVTRQPLIEWQSAFAVGKTMEEHQVAGTGEPEKLARPKDLERSQNATRADLLTTYMKGCENIRVKKMMWHAQEAQHSRQHTTTAKGDHMNRARADLHALEGFGGEAPAAMR